MKKNIFCDKNVEREQWKKKEKIENKSWICFNVLMSLFSFDILDLFALSSISRTNSGLLMCVNADLYSDDKFERHIILQIKQVTSLLSWHQYHAK